jgi:hypothetical protein
MGEGGREEHGMQSAEQEQEKQSKLADEKRGEL